ncbi:MAG: mechanosensitive ion channel [Desulfovibrio sp.]|nr:mechanosensitive ion channel [Desulfovibrio sp.]
MPFSFQSFLLHFVFCLALLTPCTVSAAQNTQPSAAGQTLQADSGSETADPVIPEEDLAGKEAWDVVWAGQRSLLEEVSKSTHRLSGNFGREVDSLTGRIQPYEEDARRLLVLANTFKNWPNPMEAVSRRISATINQLEHVLEPVLLARREAQSLQERITYMKDSLPEDMDTAQLSPEMQTYVNGITDARLRLAAVLAQYDAALAPSQALLKRLEKSLHSIDASLPVLWKDYYLQRPVPYLSPTAWEDFGQQMRKSYNGMLLRLPVEIPTTRAQWFTAGVRFCLGLALTSLLTLICYQRWGSKTPSPVTRHIFTRSLPWLCVGLAFTASSLSADGEFFRTFLGLGNICLIMAQVMLAWDMRLLHHPEVAPGPSPLLLVIPPTLCSYVLLYLPMTQPLALLIWTGLICLALLLRRYRARRDYGPLQLEPGLLDIDVVVLWICLILSLCGLHIYSQIFYLIFISCSLALQLSLGGMALVSSFHERLPQEGARAAMARLALALAAPLVLVIAVVGVLLWVCTLPGGIYLLREYLLKSVSVGETQFNVVQVLMIISVFYLTRTAVSMGSRFLAKLPKQGLSMDATLIPPLQTAFTYTLWAFFGLFVLRSLGMELSNLAMVAGGLSVGIGFGTHTIVNNFLSGLILIFSRILQVGDVVELGGVTGRVRKISVRATMVETYDNALIYVPNSEFVASRLINWTRNSRTVRREVTVGVAYGSDTELVTKLMLGVAAAHDGVLKYPTPTVSFMAFGASSLDFTLRFWVRDYDEGTATASDLRMKLDRLFREHNIDVPFPQMDVHIKEMAVSRPVPIRNAAARLSRRRPVLPRGRRVVRRAGRAEEPAPDREDYTQTA